MYLGARRHNYTKIRRTDIELRSLTESSVENQIVKTSLGLEEYIPLKVRIDRKDEPVKYLSYSKDKSSLLEITVGAESRFEVGHIKNEWNISEIVWEAIIMNDIVELINLEIYECCKLNVSTGEKVFCERSEIKTKGFTGSYFMDERTFFAIYPTEKGPIMYYEGNEYALNKELHITLRKNGKNRTFSINEYGIRIHYFESPYIGMDMWSGEEDVDLFYQIAKFYQDEEYYKDYFI